MQLIDYSHSKQILADVQQDPASTFAIGQLAEVLYSVIQGLERVQKELAERERE